MQEGPTDKPKFSYPPPRYDDGDVAYIATVTSVILLASVENLWGKIIYGCLALYCAWRWHKIKRDYTIDYLKFRRASTAENYDPDRDQRLNVGILDSIDRYTKKLTIIESQKWRQSEPITLDERYERAKEKERERERLRRGKRLKVGSRVVSIPSKVGTVTSVIKKDQEFSVKWDDGREQTYSFDDLDWIDVAP